MAKTSIAQVAYYLALLGGLLMVILGLLSLLGVSSAFGGLYFSIISGFWQGGIVMFIGGVIAIVGARRASRLFWALILIIVGIIGGGLGGLLVVLGGVIGLIAYTRKPWYKRLLPF